MAASPKAKPTPTTLPSARADRTSSVVTATLILLTVLGVVTVFWEPLAALAGGGPEAESVGEARTSSPDGGPGATPSPSVTGGAATPSAVPARIPAGIFDGSTSS